MRPFEILTIATLILSLIALLIIRKKTRWFVFIPGFLIVVVLCQLVFEGSRWQMIPTYILTFIVWLISLIKILITKKEQSERQSFFKRLLKVSGIIIIILLLIISIIPPLAIPMFKIPHPSGKFEVGSSILFFRDSTRLDLFSTKKNRYREFSVRAWYPASHGKTEKGLPYMQTDEAGYLATQLNSPSFMLNHFKLSKQIHILTPNLLRANFRSFFILHQVPLWIIQHFFRNWPVMDIS